MLIRDARERLLAIDYACTVDRRGRKVWSIAAVGRQVDGMQAQNRVLCDPNERSLRKAADECVRLAGMTAAEGA